MNPANGWVGSLLALLLLQGIGAFLLQFLPTLAPLFSEAHSWPAGMIGYLSAASMLAAILFLIGGVPMLDWLGPIRAVQVGLAVALLGLLCLLLPYALAPVAASLLIGLAYGPSMPAGSVILQRRAPVRHRALVFSIKQTAVPLGGALAGVSLPAVAAAAGWWGAVSFAAVLVVVAAFAVQPLRAQLDADRAGRPARALLRPSVQTFRRPLVLLAGQPGLYRVAFAGAALAFNQSSWSAYLVVYFVGSLDLDLATAGALFAIMQIAAIGGRILLGWLADRMDSILLVMRLVAVTAGGMSIILAFSEATWPLWSLVSIAVLAGVSVTGWNGIYLAELARRAPPGEIAEISSAGLILISLGLFLGPAVFAAVVSFSGDFRTGFLLCALPSLVSGLLLAGKVAEALPERGEAE